MQFEVIAAIDKKGGIARQGKLPWAGTAEGREDMTWFKSQTSADSRGTVAVIMGRKTWDSIDQKHRPLRGRVNIVVTSAVKENDLSYENSPIIYVPDFKSALQWCKSSGELSRCIVIGGAQIYRQAMLSPYLRGATITIIDKDYDCDTFFPVDLLGNDVTELEPHASLNKYLFYEFSNEDERLYLNLLSRTLTAPKKPNRTGVPTFSLSHQSITIGLFEEGHGNILPLLTTKKVFWKSIFHELIWFLRGSTDTSYLAAADVHIWDGNSTREFLTGRGLCHYKDGEVGPIYGRQWRAWGADYPPGSSQGIDQLARVIDLIKRDPWDRRMIVSAWNPSQIDQMALPPCHYSFQFNVDPAQDGAPKYLNCLVNMRSTDIFCGLPFNIASYALLTHIVAHITKLTPGKLTISMCDMHLYENAIEQARTQVRRTPKRFPILTFSDKITAITDPQLDDFAYGSSIDDYIIHGYAPDGYIKVNMVV